MFPASLHRFHGEEQKNWMLSSQAKCISVSHVVLHLEEKANVDAMSFTISQVLLNAKETFMAKKKEIQEAYSVGWDIASKYCSPTVRDMLLMYRQLCEPTFFGSIDVLHGHYTFGKDNENIKSQAIGCSMGSMFEDFVPVHCSEARDS
ncbi:hypothetical protein L2E82_05903 [Cichorium intybus]|uniref:Uncharacterized protein n=1 Tax=Cichorium intybus TaxID=13427 RepID=A0ACB9H8L8_CICIN|nr:hypothetical protein L2E82_05903 [Cichorium intybus]